MWLSLSIEKTQPFTFVDLWVDSKPCTPCPRKLQGRKSGSFRQQRKPNCPNVSGRRNHAACYHVKRTNGELGSVPTRIAFFPHLPLSLYTLLNICYLGIKIKQWLQFKSAPHKSTRSESKLFSLLIKLFLTSVSDTCICCTWRTPCT